MECAAWVGSPPSLASGVPRNKQIIDLPDVKEAMGGGSLTLIWRTANVGMDIAAHNTTLEYINHGDYRRYGTVEGPSEPVYVCVHVCVCVL